MNRTNSLNFPAFRSVATQPPLTEALRILLSQTHFAYLQRHYRYQRFTWRWRSTPTMIASQVFADDGTPEVIVTTLFLNGRIRHDEMRIQLL
jgi:hypothetical protein